MNIWEYIGKGCYRAKVPGGWLVMNNFYDGGNTSDPGSHLLFLKDEEHIWQLNQQQRRENE